MERPKKSAKTANRAPKSDHLVVALPKGAIDEGEKPEQTALREVSEETGVRAELVAKLADIKYYYVRNWGDQRARVQDRQLLSAAVSLRAAGQDFTGDANRGTPSVLASAGRSAERP